MVHKLAILETRVSSPLFSYFLSPLSAPLLPLCLAFYAVLTLVFLSGRLLYIVITIFILPLLPSSLFLPSEFIKVSGVFSRNQGTFLRARRLFSHRRGKNSGKKKGGKKQRRGRNERIGETETEGSGHVLLWYSGKSFPQHGRLDKVISCKLLSFHRVMPVQSQPFRFQLRLIALRVKLRNENTFLSFSFLDRFISTCDFNRAGNVIG